MVNTVRRKVWEQMAPKKPVPPYVLFPIAPYSDGIWQLADTRFGAYTAEDRRHKEMIDLIDDLIQKVRKRLHDQLQAAKTDAAKQQANREYTADTMLLNRAKAEEQRAHTDNRRVIGKCWNAPDPNPLELRIHQGLWQEKKNGLWVTY